MAMWIERHPQNSDEQLAPRDSLVLKIEFVLLLALVSLGLVVSLLSAIGAI
jgi:hypothetical protein